MQSRSETGEHTQDANDNIEWVPFPTCNETNHPLEFHYGREGELNCTIALVDDPFFHLLEFYVHADAPLTCRLPARPPRAVEVIGQPTPPIQHVPLVFALAGTLQKSHLHVSTRLNVLLHTTPLGRHGRGGYHDSGVLSSAIAYSASPLGDAASGSGRNDGGTKLVIGDPLPLQLSVRWLPGPGLPRTEGRVEWLGMGSDVCAGHGRKWALVGFIVGVIASAVYFTRVFIPQRRALGPAGLGGATPLGYGIGGATGGGSSGLGNGWGYVRKKQKD